MPSQKKKTTLRLITAEDLYRFHLVTSCEISPDGSQVVYALQHADQKTEKKFSNLWIVPTAGGDPRQVTFGDQLDSQPRWSPQGDRLAFVSNRKEEKQPQLYILPLSGGEARPLNELQGEIGYYEWSPDGKQLVLQFRKKDAEAVEREKDDHKKELGIVSRHIRRVFYKLDGYGYLPVER